MKAAVIDGVGAGCIDCQHQRCDECQGEDSEWHCCVQRMTSFFDQFFVRKLLYQFCLSNLRL